MEKRYPRATFTKKLYRMCQALDESPERIIEYDVYQGIFATARVVASALWVVGSYARGATKCGDLDAVMEITSIGAGAPLPSKIKTAFFGPAQFVRCYNGTPNNNTSGACFPDVVLIWSGKGCAWKMAIDAIPINPGAGRAARDTDCIPFRQEQLKAHAFEMDYAAQLIKEGRFVGEFIPFDSELLTAVPGGLGHEDNRRSYLTHGLGKASLKLMPAIEKIMNKLEPGGEILEVGRTNYIWGRARVYLGAGAFRLENFLVDQDIDQLIFVPHLSARGPNGAWILRRGPNHGLPDHGLPADPEPAL